MISDELQRHLPLRNLYWNSSTRPLRSIASLHIDFVQDGRLSPQANFSGADSEASKPVADTSNHSQPGNRPGSSIGARKERRHQIPGLRQTPYLKIYLLRCDNVDTYRYTARKQLREWVKENSPPSQSSASVNTQESHDAFEWLIVHVVLLDEGQARSRTPNSSKGDSRLSLRGSTVVNEKLRADFNGTSKATVNRVAQVRIARTSESAYPSELQDQDSLSDWEDFILKIKTLILSSFDLRVSQYEEDIKERDSQRNLPGWNFNTFFVLKEGLARGFESVGLVEDALTGYHELAVGLNSILESNDLAGQQKGHFKDYTDDLSAELKRALQYENLESDEGNAQGSNLPNGSRRIPGDLGSDILATGRKPFRELILANEISAFDFRCYVFAREISLLLRLANMAQDIGNDATRPVNTFRSSEQNGEPATNQSEAEDHLLLAEVCRRSVAFFASVGQTIRDDLRSSIDPLSREHAGAISKSTWDGPIEEIVASWTYSACQSILEATAVHSLTAQSQPLLRQLKGSSDHEQDNQEKAQYVSRGHLPSQTSSLPSNARISPRPSSPDQFPAISTLDAVRMLPPTSSHAGASELAAERAELVILKRRILTTIGRRQRRFNLEWADVLSLSLPEKADLEEIQLEEAAVSGTNESMSGNQYTDAVPASSIQNHELRQSIESLDAYNVKYEVTCSISINCEPD